MNYQYVEDNGQNSTNVILLLEVNDAKSYVSLVEGNSDYKKYQEWLLDDNTPLPY